MQYYNFVMADAKLRAWQALTDKQRLQQLTEVVKDTGYKIPKNLIKKWAKKDYCNGF